MIERSRDSSSSKLPEILVRKGAASSTFNYCPGAVGILS